MPPNDPRPLRLLFRLTILAALIAYLVAVPLTAFAVPASFFDTNLAQGRARFMQVVDDASGGTAVFYERSLTSSTSNVFSVDGDDGSTVWVRATRNGSAANFNQLRSGAYYNTWSVGVSSWAQVVANGLKFEFFEDSGLTTPLEINAFGVQTYDWGTCCVSPPNYTPTGTALGTAIYTIFDGGSLGPTVELLGNITTTIPSTIHFVAEIDDRDETFTQVTVSPNGNGEAFGMGGYVIFSLVPEDSVPEGSGSTPSIPPQRPDLTAATDLGYSSTDNITSDTTPDFSVTFTSQGPDDFIRLYSGGTLIATSGPAGTTGDTTVTLTSSVLSEGVHSITARMVSGMWGDETNASPALSVTIDATPPTMTITAAEVSDGETSNDPTLSLTFTSNEATTDFGAADVVVTNGSLSGFSGSGTTYTATLTPSADGEVTVNVGAGVYSDFAGNGNLAAEEFNWFSDLTAPTVVFDPADGATGVSVTTNITLTFSEAIRNLDDSELTDTNVDGLITLRDTDAGGTDIPFDATIDAGKQVITINPTSDFGSEQVVYVAIGATVEDAADNAVAASNATFTTADVEVPTLDSTTPVDDATDVDIAVDLVLTFSEPVVAGSGSITIYRSSDNSVVESIDVSSPTQISGLGTDTITVDPSSPLDYSTSYYIQIGSSALEDAGGNAYAGIADTTTWNFTTGVAPDTDGDGISDPVDGTGDRDGDGIANYLDYDPTGYFYDEDTGEIISGGRVSVSGPAPLTIIEDGSDGFYQFASAAASGNYTISVSVPGGYRWSRTCERNDPPAFDPTGLADPVVLGNGEDGSTGFLTSSACTTFYLSLSLAVGDPLIINNNFPLQVRGLPATGFAPGEVTTLDRQPEAKTYRDLGGMWLEIPTLDVSAPLVGVPSIDGEWDISWLGDNAGYLSGTAFPTWKGNTVITGHVWDASNLPGIFRRLRELRYGDIIRIHAWGDVYTYEARSNWRLSPAASNLVFAHKDLDWITLLTCEGFTQDPGTYSYRRMVQAVLISVRPEP